jgi:hypothetical protein
MTRGERGKIIEIKKKVGGGRERADEFVVTASVSSDLVSPPSFLLLGSFVPVGKMHRHGQG